MEARQIAADAINLMHQQRLDGAIETLHRGLIKYPRASSLHFEMGNALSDCRDYQNAILEYEQALKLRTVFPEAILNIAFAQCNSGRNSDAVVWFQRYIRENPKAPKLREVQAQMLMAAAAQCLDNGRAYDAKKLLEKSLQLNSKDTHAHFKMARACDELGDTQHAIAEYQEVLKLEPNHSAAIFNIAGCYQSMGKPDQAIAWFQTYLQNNPEAPDSVTVTNMIVKLRQAEQQPMLDPSTSDFVPSVMEHGKCYRWRRERLPLKVFVQDASTVRGFRPAFAKALYDAFQAWSRATENRIMFTFIDNPNQADIVFRWTGNPFDARQSSEDVEQGVCKMRSIERSQEPTISIEHADLRILTVDRESQKPLSDDDMKKTCLHELGHALGLHGHSTNNHDIMFFSVSPTVWPVLSKRDKATILKIYQSYPPLAPLY